MEYNRALWNSTEFNTRILNMKLKMNWLEFKYILENSCNSRWIQLKLKRINLNGFSFPEKKKNDWSLLSKVFKLSSRVVYLFVVLWIILVDRCLSWCEVFVCVPFSLFSQFFLTFLPFLFRPVPRLFYFLHLYMFPSHLSESQIILSRLKSRSVTTALL